MNSMVFRNVIRTGYILPKIPEDAVLDASRFRSVNLPKIKSMLENELRVARGEWNAVADDQFIFRFPYGDPRRREASRVRSQRADTYSRRNAQLRNFNKSWADWGEGPTLKDMVRDNYADKLRRLNQ